MSKSLIDSNSESQSIENLLSESDKNQILSESKRTNLFFFFFFF